MSQRRSPRLSQQSSKVASKPTSKKRIKAPTYSSESEGEDDLDDLFANESKFFSELKSYKNNHSHFNTSHHQVTAPPPVNKTSHDDYTPTKSQRKRKRTNSSYQGHRKKRKSFDGTPASQTPKKRAKEKRLSSEALEAVDFWKSLQSEKLVVKKSSISPKMTLCKPRETLTLSESDSDKDKLSEQVVEPSPQVQVDPEISPTHSNSSFQEINENDTEIKISKDTENQNESDSSSGEFSDTVESAAGIQGGSSPLFERSDEEI